MYILKKPSGGGNYAKTLRDFEINLYHEKKTENNLWLAGTYAQTFRRVGTSNFFARIFTLKLRMINATLDV